MKITDELIDRVHQELRNTCGDVRNDYFGLLYLEQEFELPRKEAIDNVAFGGNDYGIDGYYFDRDRRNLYLLQFKWSPNPAQFRASFDRLISDGVKAIFGSEKQDSKKNDILLELDKCLVENFAIIDRVFFLFVFNGDPAAAERSKVLEKLSEDLENKKYLLDKYFTREIEISVQFRTSKAKKTGQTGHVRKSRTYDLQVSQMIETKGPDGQIMAVGAVRLVDIDQMYSDMQQRFFERNIRSALVDSESVNKAITRAFRDIVINESVDSSLFQFNHNGITLTAIHVTREGAMVHVTEPRLLNGAQTVSTLRRFMADNKDNKKYQQNTGKLNEIKVICKLITNAKEDFVTNVTINNNRQNPVEPWNLHANDRIQLELEDHFRDKHIFYERQENAFQQLSDEEFGDSGITEKKPIELVQLAKTFLVSDGEIDKLSDLRRVFENEKQYESVFNRNRLNADYRHVVLCYKIPFRINRIIRDIYEKGTNKYEYIFKARNLLWALTFQGIANSPDLEFYSDLYGTDMSAPAGFTQWISGIATTKCRPIIAQLTKRTEYSEKIEQEKYGFLRANATYKECMEIAHQKFGWSQRKLR
jgi:hypothetical protein